MGQYEDDVVLVTQLVDIEAGLNSWEVEFVESVAEQVLEDGRRLTENQREKAREILADRG